MSILSEKWTDRDTEGESTQVRTDRTKQYVFTSAVPWIRHHIIELHNNQVENYVEEL